LLFLACEGSVPPRGLLAGGVLGRRVRARSPVLTARHSRRCALHRSFCRCVHPAHRLYDLPPPDEAATLYIPPPRRGIPVLACGHTTSSNDSEPHALRRERLQRRGRPDVIAAAVPPSISAHHAQCAGSPPERGRRPGWRGEERLGTGPGRLASVSWTPSRRRERRRARCRCGWPTDRRRGPRRTGRLADAAQKGWSSAGRSAAA
jgi:hypothetical protein